MSNLVIEIVNVTIETVPTARGQYKKAKVIYKNKTFQDKVEEKQVMDFTFPIVFNKLEESKFGDILFISRTKNDKGYWDWTNASTDDIESEQQVNNVPTTNVGPKPIASPKSTYETPEERAARQVMIVRQSSLSTAVAALKLDKAVLDAQDVINMAVKFENYVMGKRLEDLVEDHPFDVR